MRKARKTGNRDTRAVASTNEHPETTELDQLPTKALKLQLKELTGIEAKSNNRPYLMKKIGKALDEMAKEAPTDDKKQAPHSREPDPRIPKPGTVLKREYKGKTIRATVSQQGFQYLGRTYRSLSAVAKEATGTTWNGLVFFKLIPYASRKTPDAQ